MYIIVCFTALTVVIGLLNYFCRLQMKAVLFSPHYSHTILLIGSYYLSRVYVRSILTNTVKLILDFLCSLIAAFRPLSDTYFRIYECTSGSHFQELCNRRHYVQAR